MEEQTSKRGKEGKKAKVLFLQMFDDDILAEKAGTGASIPMLASVSNKIKAQWKMLTFL